MKAAVRRAAAVMAQRTLAHTGAIGVGALGCRLEDSARLLVTRAKPSSTIGAKENPQGALRLGGVAEVNAGHANQAKDGTEALKRW